MSPSAAVQLIIVGTTPYLVYLVASESDAEKRNRFSLPSECDNNNLIPSLELLSFNSLLMFT